MPASKHASSPSHPLSRRSFVAAAACAAAATTVAARQAHASSVSSWIKESLLGGGSSNDAVPTTTPAAPSTGRPSLLKGIAAQAQQAEPITPAVEPYTVAEDFSNVINIGDAYLSDLQLSYLRTNGFFVMRETGNEFFEHYENNRYNLFPNFVTVDAMTHTYHLYFSHLLRTTERTYLAPMVARLTELLLQASEAQLETLLNTEWQVAAERNVAFFCVAAQLQGLSLQTPERVASEVGTELDMIMAAQGINLSAIFGQMEDYTQYAPRGYYEGDPALETYFRTMMWYGRMNFLQREVDLDRSALLMTMALSDPDIYALWEAIYAVTSFFAGASDDNGYAEYRPLLDDAYGTDATPASLPGNAAWDVYHAATAELPSPQINGVPSIDEGVDADHLDDAKGFRLMGQRFSLDESIFTQLTYNRVNVNPAGEKRLLPDALDVPAAFGSNEALAILEGLGALEYEGYAQQMDLLRAQIAEAPAETWDASLYSEWLWTIEPLTHERGAGYPPFMQSVLWTRKNLQSFLGSYTELKHDTVLYSKQVMAEMGGGPIDPRDDRGYVEPEPEVFGRLTSLVAATSAGLQNYGLLGEEDAYNLGLLQELAARLQTIAAKELRNELPTDDEFELIRSFGGQIEHFWQEVYKNEADDAYFTTRDFPAAVVVDIATDPNGRVLEVGTGQVSTIYVVVPVEGSLRVASGVVYSFYQFEQPLDQRLTDTAWRQMLGINPADDGSYIMEPQVQPAFWTDDFSLCWRDLQ